MTKYFQGLYTALITPFHQGHLDLDILGKLISLQEEAMVDGIVIGGSTGEAFSLSDQEFRLLLEQSRKHISKNTKMIVGIAANSDVHAITKAKIATDIGADALMCVTPYYNKPPQRGIVDYFESIARNIDIPMILYSVPSRTGVDFDDQTIITLSQIERIQGLKDSGTDIERPLRIGHLLPSDFSLLSGEDKTCMAYSAHGGVGCVSVASNIIPKLCKKIQNHLSEDKFADTLVLQSGLIKLYNALFVATNPIPIKYAASILNLCSEEVRAPLFSMDNDTLKQKIKTEILNVYQSEIAL